MSGTTGVVTFDYGAWSARYPELVAATSATLAGMYFAEATMYLDNTSASPVIDLGQRAVLLNMLTAHIAKLNNANATGLVGRVSSASEGSVSVQTTYAEPVGSRAWYDQTHYGTAYWQATPMFRLFQYRPGPQPNFSPSGALTFGQSPYVSQ